ncbi:MAG: AbrB/MazE/SpoVT family DNA-binding domain-containing protein [Terriglobales bacterium]
MTSAVSEKGQVTIPKKLRISLGIRPGTRLEFCERDGELIARRIPGRDPIEGLVGILRGRRTDDIMRELRGPGWDPNLDPESLDEEP